MEKIRTMSTNEALEFLETAKRALRAVHDAEEKAGEIETKITKLENEQLDAQKRSGEASATLTNLQSRVGATRAELAGLERQRDEVRAALREAENKLNIAREQLTKLREQVK